ncbi:hypothetical protein ACH4D4_01175 [Streptomyces pristinaespiralis]|uniref:hypothetical protein n=1 Tax=Streptomyces pristinaespiralis TaxID=38300 RepID=UPI00379054E7
MLPEALRHPRVRGAATAGTALAVTLLPLVAGVLLAKTMAADPMTPVNALITSGGHRARVSPAHLRGCGRSAARRCRAAGAAARASRPRLRPEPAARSLRGASTPNWRTWAARSVGSDTGRAA